MIMFPIRTVMKFIRYNEEVRNQNGNDIHYQASWTKMILKEVGDQNRNDTH